MSAIKLDGLTLASTANSAVNLDSSVNIGTSSYGFAQLKLTANESLGNVVWDTILGDTSNITKPNSDHDIRLSIAGIYCISFSATFYISGEERNVTMVLKDSSDDSVIASAADSIKQADSNITYGNAAGSYTGYFPANSDIYFNTISASNSNSVLEARSHASIVLIRKTA